MANCALLKYSVHVTSASVDSLLDTRHGAVFWGAKKLHIVCSGTASGSNGREQPGNLPLKCRVMNDVSLDVTLRSTLDPCWEGIPRGGDGQAES